MALIKCPDCSKEHSDAAPACPNCGRPNTTTTPQQPPPQQQAQKSGMGCGQIGCLSAIGGVILLYAIGSQLPDTTTYTPSGSPSAASQESPPASSEPQLEVIKYTWSTEYGYATLEGQVKNISGEPLRSVTAVATFYDKNGGFITSDDALIDYNPILPGQVSPFKVMATENPAMHKAGVEFKFLLGGTINTRHR